MASLQLKFSENTDSIREIDALFRKQDKECIQRETSNETFFFVLSQCSEVSDNEKII